MIKYWKRCKHWWKITFKYKNSPYSFKNCMTLLVLPLCVILQLNLESSLEASLPPPFYVTIAALGAKHQKHHKYVMSCFVFQVRVVTKYRHCEGKLIVKVTDDQVVRKLLDWKRSCYLAFSEESNIFTTLFRLSVIRSYICIHQGIGSSKQMAFVLWSFKIHWELSLLKLHENKIRT